MGHAELPGQSYDNLPGFFFGQIKVCGKAGDNLVGNKKNGAATSAVLCLLCPTLKALLRRRILQSE